MSSITDDEHDDTNIFDQLKSIKAFTLDQLYCLHPDVIPPSSQDTLSPTIAKPFHDKNLYQNLVEYEQLRDKLAKLKSQVKHLHRRTFDHIENVWVFVEENPRKIGMCQQGKIAETSLKFKQAFINSKQLNTLSVAFSELSELITKDYIYYSFESQIKRHKIATHLSVAYQISNLATRRERLKSCIVTLIDFIKHLSDFKSDFLLQCRNWIRCLIKRFLEHESTEDYRFIISQLCKGPAGTADWSADLIECKPYHQVAEFESTPQYISHCAALLSELFNNLKASTREVIISTASNPTADDQRSIDNQNWSLIDPRFSCSEELNLQSKNGNTLSEVDVLKFCLKIPIAQIFRAYVRKCLESEEFDLETEKSYEYIMLKLLTIGTIIIKTYQTGLETFNSIQYGNLIEYLSSQIRRVVIILSDQWNEFKRRLKGTDNALMMRLQVEYDNFILRSILIILELRLSGIWRFLSRIEQDQVQEVNFDSNSWSTDSLRPAFAKLLQVTGLSSSPTTATATTSQQDAKPGNSQHHPVQSLYKSSSSTSLTYGFSIEWFKEVSEPMLWHILWQFYHNAFVNSCDYHSDNYWLEKFREKSVVYLFVNKIKDSSPSECSYLLNSITSILLSRTRQDSKLVHFIATEIFNMSFKHKEMKSKITKQGVKSLIKSAEQFPNLISLYISYMVNEEFDDDMVALIKGCSLIGWICQADEVNIIAQWLIEYPLTSVHNKVARLLISKILLNSQSTRETSGSIYQAGKILNKPCFVDLKLRRRLALLLYETTKRHVPENNDFGPQSLGTFVEVTFGGLFCERNSASQNNLIELAVDTSYQQLYVWCWRLLFTFRLHILNQPDTDWSDVQTRSGTSRSIKNTVLVNDSFHPVPSIQDSECLSLSQGLQDQNPVASFIYLSITDATWQRDTLDSCINHLNIMANSGHLTPSLMCMKYLTVCHLNDLSETTAKDPRCLDYFTKIITSNFDATRLASLMISQLQNVKQYRQLQLSEFYIIVLLGIAANTIKQISSSWFSASEFTLEKIACLLDYLVKFNFTTQRLEIIRKFYDCSYSIQGCTTASSWFGSFMTTTTSLSANSTRREFLTTLHALTDKFKKYTWLRWVTAECDTMRQEKIWEDIVAYLSKNETATLDQAIKKVCPQVNASILKATLPIYSWVRQIFDIVESDLSHPLCPLIWYNFFLNYFANSLNGVSVGKQLVSQEALVKLLSRLDSLYNYHLYKHRNWASTGSFQQNSLTQLYRAYRLWLQDATLQDAYVDIDRLKQDYLVPLLKSVMESTTGDACIQYIDIQTIEVQNKNLCQVWSTATKLEGNHLLKEIIFVDSNQDESMEILTEVDDEASDAASLIVKMPTGGGGGQQRVNSSSLDTPYKRLLKVEEELTMPLEEEKLSSGEEYKTIDELMELIKRNFHTIFEECSMFGSNIGELENIKTEIIDLIQQLYTNKKKEYIRTVSCADGSECVGPARIKFEVEEATMDDRRSQCIQDRQRQAEEMINELLLMPGHRTVKSSILIEENVRQLVGDSHRAKTVIESLLNWISDKQIYDQLTGSFHPGNNLLKAILEILSGTDEVDTYNRALIDVCSDHPGSVHIFSPHLSPIACSSDCFLELYKKISSRQAQLGPMAMFVLLSKFDVNSWLKNIRDKEAHHEIIKTTCQTLKGMGKQPDESFVLTYELYKNHIQVELALPDRRRPEEISLLLEQFLHIMDEQMLAPELWTDFMVILGLEKRVQPLNRRKNDEATMSNLLALPGEHDESTIAGLIEDISRLAESQLVLDYHSVNKLIQMMSQFVKYKNTSTEVTLLELYQDYMGQFSVVMISVTFMWLKAMSEQYPDNHEIIWRQFNDLWYDWVFLSKNCQNVGKSSYSLVANLYVAGLRYMIFKMQDSTQLVLKSTLDCLTNYVRTTKEVVYLELTILQRCLKNLPWPTLVASPEDFQNLVLLSEQENYNVSDLVSHILLQVNIREALIKVEPSLLPHVTERLATTIVLQSAQLKGFRLNGCFFTLIPVANIAKIANLILPRMEFVNLEHSQTNKLLVNLLRFMCIRLELSEPNQQQPQQQQYQFNSDDDNDSFERSVIYARFVSNYLVDLIKNHPSVVKHHKSYLYAIMDNSLRDLRILISPDVDIKRKTAIYRCLLDCCSNSAIDDDARLLIARSLIRSDLLKDRPIVVMEIFHSIGQIISDGRVLVYTVERMIGLYLSMNGHYEKVWKSFNLRVLPSDLYLEACIEEGAQLALLVYFESLVRNTSGGDGGSSGMDTSQASNNFGNEQQMNLTNSNKIWSSFFHWISKISASLSGHQSQHKQDKRDEMSSPVSDHTRLVVAWMRLLHLLEPNLNQFISCIHLLIHHSDSSIEVDELTTSDHDLTQALSKQQPVTLNSSHKSLVEFIKQLVALYDANNSGGLWSYLRTTRTEQTSRLSIIALAVASFLSDRTLACLTQTTLLPSTSSTVTTSASSSSTDTIVPVYLTTMRDEFTRLRRTCLTKLQQARKSKYYLDSAHFIEALIESVNRNDKVQYSEGLQLMITFVQSIYSSESSTTLDFERISKMLPMCQ